MSDDADWRPKAVEGLEINAMADGYIVHQPERDRVHYLNQTAAIVFELCTGRNAATDLARLMQLAYDLSAPPSQEVDECLRTLRAEGLIA